MAKIRATGADLVAISPQRQQFLRQMAEKNRLEFELLSDQGNEVAGKFDLVFELPPDLREAYKSFGVDLARFNEDDSWRLPMPGRFVIDEHSIIRHVDVDPDYTIRPEPASTVAVLENLRRRTAEA